MRKIDKILCNVVHLLRTTDNYPKILKKQSYKKYGWRDDIGRYWWENYFKIVNCKNKLHIFPNQAE